MPNTRQILIRDARPADGTALHAINEAAVPGVNSVSDESLSRLVRECADLALVAECANCLTGFAICMREGIEYDSPNYRWLLHRYAKFVYIDRIAVAPESRGGNVGQQLYESIIGHYEGRVPVLLAEVSLAPSNPGSLRFHHRHGFRPIGERWDSDGDKGVVFLERPLMMR
ncbi:MAG: GNAT family N-acetyltransferase [Hyphomicrobiaceae bacterium]